VIYAHPIRQELPRITFLPKAIRYVPCQHARHFSELRRSFAQYLKKSSAKTRSTLLRKVRRLVALYGRGVCWPCYRDVAGFAEFHRLALEPAKKSWQARRLPGWVLSSSEEFPRSMTELAARDALIGYIPFHNTQPVAYLYMFCRGDLLQTSFSVTVRNMSIGRQALSSSGLCWKGCSRKSSFRFLISARVPDRTKVCFRPGALLGHLLFRRSTQNLCVLKLHSCVFSCPGAQRRRSNYSD
jgi:Acetyltransferase (GNAT) domain